MQIRRCYQGTSTAGGLYTFYISHSEQTPAPRLHLTPGVYRVQLVVPIAGIVSVSINGACFPILEWFYYSNPLADALIRTITFPLFVTDDQNEQIRFDFAGWGNAQPVNTWFEFGNRFYMGSGQGRSSGGLGGGVGEVDEATG